MLYTCTHACTHTCMHAHTHSCTHTHTGPAHNSKTTQSYYSKKCIWTGRVIRGVRHNPVVYVLGLPLESEMEIHGRVSTHGAVGCQIDPSMCTTWVIVLHDWYNKDHGICYPVCGMVHIKNLCWSILLRIVHKNIKGNPLLPLHGLLFLISMKGSYIFTTPQTGYYIPQPLLH